MDRNKVTQTSAGAGEPGDPLNGWGGLDLMGNDSALSPVRCQWLTPCSSSMGCGAMGRHQQHKPGYPMSDDLRYGEGEFCRLGK